MCNGARKCGKREWGGRGVGVEGFLRSSDPLNDNPETICVHAS